MAQQEQQPESSKPSSGQVLALVSLLVALLAFPGCWYGGLSVFSSAENTTLPSLVSLGILALATLLPVVALSRMNTMQATDGAEVPAWMALAVVGFWWILMIVVLGVFETAGV